MGQYEVIRPRRTSWRERMVEDVRSWMISRLNPRDPVIARYFSDSAQVHSGVPVSEFTAMNYSAVWAAVSLYAGHVGMLPLNHYRRTADGGKERFASHPLHKILHDRPNAQMTSVTFREVLQSHALLWGNGYAEIERDGAGRVVALWPLMPWNVTPYFPTPTSPLRYRVINPSGGPSGRQIEFEEGDIFHLKGLSDDGILGASVVGRARESLGLGIAMERFGATFFGNGATMGGVVSVKGPKPNQQTEKEHREQIEARHQGVDRSHRLLVLYNDAQYQRTSIPPEDAQFLESRQFQVTEVARWFNLPPHKLKDLSRATFSNIEHQSIEYVTDSLLPWLRRWEAEISRKLIAPAEQNIQFAEFVLEGLLRGDATTRANFYRTMSEIGAMTINEIRVRENLSPIPGGDRLMVPKDREPLRASRGAGIPAEIVSVKEDEVSR